ncbi:type III pantothenate kinase [Methylophilaceae bacterium]|nr:type III pantothenate kinase [Methylophilaceae bacterium]
MILTIDAGNTRTKWAVFNTANAIEASGVLSNTSLADSPPAWRDCTLAIISNVAGDGVAAKLKAMLGEAIKQSWISATASELGIKNGYERPEMLGSDRWAAMIGAKQYMQQSCLVVNAGTALTIDVLLREPASMEHVFVGGVILPGRHLMHQSLCAGTHAIHHVLPESTADKHFEWPRNTESAIRVGALLAMVGAIEQVYTRSLRKTDSGMHCILSGGDALPLAEQLRGSAVISDIVVIEDLVLRGLLVIGRRS